MLHDGFGLDQSTEMSGEQRRGERGVATVLFLLLWEAKSLLWVLAGLLPFYLCSGVLILMLEKEFFWQWWWRKITWKQFQWVPFYCIHSPNGVVLTWLFFISETEHLWTDILFWGSFLSYFSSNRCHQDALFCHSELFLFSTVNCFRFICSKLHFLYIKGVFPVVP